MTDQTIHIERVAEIIGLIFLPVITRVASHTSLLIALGADTEIIYLVDLPYSYRFIPALHIERFALPSEMCGVHDLLGGFLVAFQTGTGYIRTSFKFTLDNIGMAGMCGVGWHEIPWVLILLGLFWPEKNYGYDQDGQNSGRPQ